MLRVHAAFARVRQRIAALRLDAIAIVAGDHVEAFFLDRVPALAVYVGAEARGRSARTAIGFRSTSRSRAPSWRRAIERGFDLLYTQDAPLDYAFYVPLHFTMPEPARADRAAARERVPAAAADAAALLRVGRAPSARSCAPVPSASSLMASGGLSHFPGTDRYASPGLRVRPPAARAARGGRGRELAAITAEELDKAGNVELRTWITLLGAVGDARAEVYCYEPSWHHGNAVVEWAL